MRHWFDDDVSHPSGATDPPESPSERHLANISVNLALVAGELKRIADHLDESRQIRKGY